MSVGALPLAAAAVALLFAIAACALLLSAARQRARQEARQLLEALRSSDALLQDELEPLLEEGQRLLDAAAVSRADGAVPLETLSSLWSRTTALHLRILADVDAQREALAAAGVDMRKALESLGRADIAVQDFCSGASRSSNPGSEILHAQARRASATVGEVAAQVRQVRLRIQEKQGALRSVAG